MTKNFEKTHFEDRNLQKLQDNVSNAIRDTIRSPIVNGTHVEVTLASGSNRVSHPLQRLPVGWSVVDRNGVATVYRTAWDTKTITLTASATITIKLWMY